MSRFKAKRKVTQFLEESGQHRTIPAPPGETMSNFFKLVHNILQPTVFVAAGIYLLLHNHEVAGGFLVFIGAVTAVHYTGKS